MVTTTTILIVVAEFVFTAICLPVYKGIYLAESKLLSVEIQYSRYGYPTLYLARVILIKIVLAIGLCWIVRKVFSLFWKNFGSKFKAYSKPIVLILALFIAVHLLLFFAESRTTSFQLQGFTKNANENDTLIYYRQHLADSAGMNYENKNFKWWQNQHVNEQGFLSDIDYTVQTIDSLHALGKKVVFVIGDSFVEGVSETIKGGQHYNTYDSTFIRRLNAASKDYVIFSFGVGGSDPVNYQLIAAKYLAYLKPDLVVVCFCHNDVFYYDRKATPYIPKYYQTNYGWLSSNVPIHVSGVANMILPTVDSAFNYYMRFLRIENTNTITSRLAKRLKLFSNLYIKYEMGLNLSKAYLNKEFAVNYQQLSFNYLKIIDKRCIACKIPFLITYIPEPDFSHPEKKYRPAPKKYEEIFLSYSSSVFYPGGLLSSKDYISQQNWHFNDEGNRNYAAFLDSAIRVGLKR